MIVYIIVEYTGPYINGINSVYDNYDDAELHLNELKYYHPREEFRILERKVIQKL